METLHIRANNSTIEKLMKILNEFSKNGEEVEILDNTIFNIEKNMIEKAIFQKENQQTFSHDDVWKRLLD